MAAPRARVRHAQGVGRRRPHCERKGARAAPRQPRRPSGLGIRGRLRGCDVAHVAAAHAHRLRGRYGGDALGARAVRAGILACGARLEAPRQSRPPVRAAGGSRRPAGGSEQGGTRARLDAPDELRRSGAHDGGRGPGASVVKVLVTGADGFVGRWVIRRLLGDGREVYGAVRPGQSPAPVPPAADLAPAEREAVRWLPLELLDADSVRKVVDLPYDAVLHLAAISSGTEATRDPGYAWSVNAAGTARVVQVLAEAKRTGRADPVVLVISTGEVYGAAREPRPRRETDPVAPCSPYAASKAGAELAGLEAWHRTGLRVIVARSFAHRRLHPLRGAAAVREAGAGAGGEGGQLGAGAGVSPRARRGGRVRAAPGQRATGRDLQCRLGAGRLARRGILSDGRPDRHPADSRSRPGVGARRGHLPSRRRRGQAARCHGLGAPLHTGRHVP